MKNEVKNLRKYENVKTAFYFFDEDIIQRDKCFLNTSICTIVIGLGVKSSCTFEEFCGETNKDYFSQCHFSLEDLSLESLP